MRNKLRTKNEGSWGKEWPLISFNRFFLPVRGYASSRLTLHYSYQTEYSLN